MKQQFQINVTAIENGFLLASPPSESAIVQQARIGQQPGPTIQYCADFAEVVAKLKGVWPTELKD